MLRRIPVFFYGLFMDVDLLRRRGIDPVDVRVASVSGFSLRIAERAALAPDPTGCVYGVVMDLTHAQVELLYAEPSVSLYKPEAVTARLRDGSSLAALCWNLVNIPAPQGGDGVYATKLRELAQRLGLPRPYTEGIH